MEFSKVIKLRKSARAYGTEQVGRQELEQVLMAGCGAPIGRALYENYHLAVVQDAALLGRIDKTAAEAAGNPDMHPLYGAPTVIFVSGKAEASPWELVCANAACIVDQMHLMATDLGLGSVYLWGCVQVIKNDPSFTKDMGVPEGFVPASALAIGYNVEQPGEREIPPDKIATTYVR